MTLILWLVTIYVAICAGAYFGNRLTLGLKYPRIPSGVGCESCACAQLLRTWWRNQAAGSSSDALSGLLTRVETGHMAISSAGNGTSRSCGSGSRPSQRS